MNRKNNGVTLTALVVTLIVLTIMLGVTLSISTELLSDSKIKSYIAEMYTVQARVKSMAETLEFETDDYRITARETDDSSQKRLKHYYDVIFSETVSTSLLERLGYYDPANNINKIGIKVTGEEELENISGFKEHPEYKQEPLANCWFIWDQNVISDNGFDANMISEHTQYYVNFYNYEVVYSKGFTTANTPKQTVYSLSDMLNLK